MQLHTFDRTTGYEIIEFLDKDVWFDILLALDGSSRAANWKPFRVRRTGKARKRPFRASDCPYCESYALIFRRAAVDALRDILDAHGELLPVEDEGGAELYLYNPRAIDALDQKLSIGSRGENGKLESASRPVFIPSLVEGIDIFKLAVPRAGQIYVSDRFVARWKQAQLEGLDFKVVWDSDWPLPEPEPPPVQKPPSAEYVRMEAYLQGLETTERVTAMAEQAPKNYATLKAAAEACAVRWEWASDTLHSYEPAYFEINKFPRGKVFPTKPDPMPCYPHEYGYDVHGRVVAERRHREFPTHMHESFFLHESDGIMEISYDYHMPDNDWIGVTWFTVREKRVVATHGLSSLGNIVSYLYQYDDQGRLIRCDRRVINPPSYAFEDWYEFEFDAKGKISRIHWCYPGGRRYLHFEQVTRKTTFRRLKRDLLQGLTAAIVDAVGRAGITDEVYVLAVRYFASSYEHMLPPSIGINTVPERARLMQVHGDDGFDAIWSPCEWLPDWGELDVPLSPELQALCEAANQDISQNEREEEAAVFMFQLARALNKAVLPIRRADEFVCVLVAEELGNMEEQVEQQISARMRKKLVKAGWLPRQ